MIKPECIVSKGWDDYEAMLAEDIYLDNWEAGLIKDVWNSDDIDDPREVSEYYRSTNEVIFAVLEGNGEFIYNKFYSLD